MCHLMIASQPRQCWHFNRRRDAMSDPKDQIFIDNKDGAKLDVLTYIRSEIVERLVGGAIPVKVAPISAEKLYAIYGKKYKARSGFGYFLDGFRAAEKYHKIEWEKADETI